MALEAKYRLDGELRMQELHDQLTELRCSTGACAVPTCWVDEHCFITAGRAGSHPAVLCLKCGLMVITSTLPGDATVFVHPACKQLCTLRLGQWIFAS